jgi:hypothetical protein
MEGATRIFDLPEQQQHQQHHKQPSQSLDDSTISELMEQLKDAGVTRLPSRDIPLSTQENVIDPNTVPTYVPTKRVVKFDDDGNDDDCDDVRRRVPTRYIENIYDEIQTPLFVGVMYFIFQLPFFKKYIFYFFPALISSDGSYNLFGFLFVSTLYSVIFYIFSKIMNHF